MDVLLFYYVDSPYGSHTVCQGFFLKCSITNNLITNDQLELLTTGLLPLIGGKVVNIHLYLFMIKWQAITSWLGNLPHTDQDNVHSLCLSSVITKCNKDFFFFNYILCCCPLYYIMTWQINQWITCIVVHVHCAENTYKECQCVTIIISHYSESVHKWQKTTTQIF